MSRSHFPGEIGNEYAAEKVEGKAFGGFCDATTCQAPNLAARLSAPSDAPGEGFTSIHGAEANVEASTDFDAASPSEFASNQPASDAPPSSDAGDTFPGDLLPAGETEAASPDALSDEPGLAVDVIAWADKLIDDLPFLVSRLRRGARHDRGAVGRRRLGCRALNNDRSGSAGLCCASFSVGAEGVGPCGCRFGVGDGDAVSGGAQLVLHDRRVGVLTGCFSGGFSLCDTQVSLSRIDGPGCEPEDAQKHQNGQPTNGPPGAVASALNDDGLMCPALGVAQRCGHGLIDAAAFFFHGKSSLLPGSNIRRWAMVPLREARAA